MSRGLGKRQREILEKLEHHRDHPRDYNGVWQRHRAVRIDRSQSPRKLVMEPLDPPVYHEKPEYRRDRFPEWMTVRELAGLRSNDFHDHHSSAVEATRRAVRTLEAAGLVQTKMIWRNNHGQKQLGVRLAP
jgi:hypothetical protein